MMSRRTVLNIGTMFGMTALGVPLLSEAATEQQELIDSSRTVIQEARHDPQFGTAPDLFARARAVMVVPSLVKGGFFVGGEGGNAVLLARQRDGSWGNPAFYVLGSASFGLQIGLQVAEVILFVMSEKALQAWTRDEFKLGAQAGLTVLVVGSSAQAATTTNADVDIIAWAKSKGAYIGLTLEGSVIKPRNEWNQAYYGRPVTAVQIINGDVTSHPAANQLRMSLSQR